MNCKLNIKVTKYLQNIGNIHKDGITAPKKAGNRNKTQFLKEKA